MALGACSEAPIPPCPPVRVDSNTARFVKFQKNDRDLTQVAYAIEIVGFDGQCRHSKDAVDVTMDITFDVIAGPAGQAETIEVPYYLAIPQFYPQAEGKRVMTFTAKVPNKPGLRARFKESGVHARIPLRRNEPPASYDVYTGLQMSTDDADYNRARRAYEVESLRSGN